MHIRLSARPTFSSAGDPSVRHSFILSRGGNNWTLQVYFWEKLSQESLGCWTQKMVLSPGGYYPLTHTLGRQGHNSSQWLGNHTPTPSSTTLTSKLLVRDVGNEHERRRMCASSTFTVRPGKQPTFQVQSSAGQWTGRSLHVQLHASLLSSQGGLKGDALLSTSSQGWGAHRDLAFPSARSHAGELRCTVGPGDWTQDLGLMASNFTCQAISLVHVLSYQIKCLFFSKLACDMLFHSGVFMSPLVLLILCLTFFPDSVLLPPPPRPFSFAVVSPLCVHSTHVLIPALFPFPTEISFPFSWSPFCCLTHTQIHT